MSNSEKMKNKKGFTLVELLVVIAIVGILSTVAIVNLNSARDKARVATALAWGADVKALFVLCDDEGGTVTGWTSGGNFCSATHVGVWPDDMPEGYSGAFPTVNTGSGTGNWQYVIFDSVAPILPLIWCDNVNGCNPA